MKYILQFKLTNIYDFPLSWLSWRLIYKENNILCAVYSPYILKESSDYYDKTKEL